MNRQVTKDFAVVICHCQWSSRVVIWHINQLLVCCYQPRSLLVVSIEKKIFSLLGAYQTTATGSNLPASLSPQAEQILNSYNIVVTKDFTQ